MGSRTTLARERERAMGHSSINVSLLLKNFNNDSGFVFLWLFLSLFVYRRNYNWKENST